jgi:glycosyltransferase involved in cell wall biosynthesis
LIEILQKENYDVVQIETIFLTPYISTIRKYSKAKIVLRAHNIEHLIWKRLYTNCKSLFKKIYLLHLVRTLRMHEMKAINQVDGIITISKPDLDFFVTHKCKTPIKVIPFGVIKSAIDAVEPTFTTNESEEINIGYIGSMNWMPNIEGINWFLNEVWENVVKKNNKAIFHLAGRNIPKQFYEMDVRNIVIHGEVESADDFIKSNDIMIAPLFSGSGIRIKIIESMLHGKPVVTTTVGAEGINFTDRHDILIANTVDEFVYGILSLSTNADLRKIVGTNAHELIHLDHNMSIITPQLVQFYQSLQSHG